MARFIACAALLLGACTPFFPLFERTPITVRGAHHADPDPVMCQNWVFEKDPDVVRLAQWPGRSANPPGVELAPMSAAPLQFLLLLFAGWVDRRQQAVIDYLVEENRSSASSWVAAGCGSQMTSGGA